MAFGRGEKVGAGEDGGHSQYHETSVPGAITHVFTHVSRRLLLSYVLDWIVIFATAGIGGAFAKIKGNRHPFDLNDTSISYPYHGDTVSVATLLVLAIPVPAISIFLACLIFPSQSPSPLSLPLSANDTTTPRALAWRRRLWNLNVGWMGLGLSLAGAFMVTEGLKDLIGKPRPDLLARCNPNLSNIRAHQIGGLGQGLGLGPVLVGSDICQAPDNSRLQDGFASFPSGHSSTSFSALFYLTLFLAARFGVAIPLVLPSYHPPRLQQDAFNEHPNPAEGRMDHDHNPADGGAPQSYGRSAGPSAPAPAVHLPILLIISLPTLVAIFVAASRWFNNKHHGFDIISGSLIGIFFASFAIRWYNTPTLRQRRRVAQLQRARYAGETGSNAEHNLYYTTWEPLNPRGRDNAFWDGPTLGSNGRRPSWSWHRNHASQNNTAELNDQGKPVIPHRADLEAGPSTTNTSNIPHQHLHHQHSHRQSTDRQPLHHQHQHHHSHSYSNTSTGQTYPYSQHQQRPGAVSPTHSTYASANNRPISPELVTSGPIPGQGEVPSYNPARTNSFMGPPRELPASPTTTIERKESGSRSP